MASDVSDGGIRFIAVIDRHDGVKVANRSVETRLVEASRREFNRERTFLVQVITTPSMDRVFVCLAGGRVVSQWYTGTKGGHSGGRGKGQALCQ